MRRSIYMRHAIYDEIAKADILVLRILGPGQDSESEFRNQD